MLHFTMRWPGLGLSVACESCGENEEALRIFMDNMPIKTVQGHEMVGGWMLRDRSVVMNQRFFDIPASKLSLETMKDAPVGRISMLFPQGRMTELLVKYDNCDDFRSYVPVAKVAEQDLETLKEAGRLQWRSATRSKEVIAVECVVEDH